MPTNPTECIDPPPTGHVKGESMQSRIGTICAILSEAPEQAMTYAEIIFSLLEEIPNPSHLHSQPIRIAFMVKLFDCL